jgi:gamma-glutamylcyclotransferase (GGCT)/AIG2-like uncharacterized protein YtfP
MTARQMTGRQVTVRRPVNEGRHLFVYGTLMVGHRRWPILEPFVEDGVGGAVPSTVPGRLFDTGLDYPAARFELPGVIQGQIFVLRPQRAVEALDVLDHVEGGVEGDYHRVEVLTDAGLTAWSYQFGGEVDGLVDLDGRWTGV